MIWIFQIYPIVLDNAMAKKPTKEKAAKKPSLDIKDEMYHADNRNLGWLESQPEELAKTFSPLIAMKWFTGVDGPYAEHYIQTTNSLLNVGFWDLSKHPELQWKLMAIIGTGTQRHNWIPMASRRKTISKLNQELLKLYPHLNDTELSLLKSKYTLEDMKQLLLDMALSDAEIKPLIEEFKKTNG